MEDQEKQDGALPDVCLAKVRQGTARKGAEARHPELWKE